MKTRMYRLAISAASLATVVQLLGAGLKWH